MTTIKLDDYIKKLRNYDFSCISELDEYDRLDLTYYIKEKEEFDDVLKILVNNYNSINKYFIFELIYDNELYKDITLKLLSEIDENYLQDYHIGNLIYKTSFGCDYIISRSSLLLNKHTSSINILLLYMLKYFIKYKENIKRISMYNDLHVRYLVISYIIKFYPEYIDDIYENLLSVFKLDGELMDSKEISEICYALLNVDYYKYMMLKEFIFANYESNYLSSLLIKNDCIDEFKKDSDTLFSTSANYRYKILIHYGENVSKELLENMKEKIKYFRDKESVLNIIYKNNLGLKLEELVEKYLSISQSEFCHFVASGSTTYTYRIGDYAFKLSTSKWSYEDVVCPNLFLINKNLEEYYARDINNHIRAALEIQKYLSRTTDDLDEKYFELFMKELDNLGYQYTDHLRTKVNNNTRLLDSYMDADTNDFKNVPSWFKEVPLVLIDRDRIYKKNVKIKQIV